MSRVYEKEDQRSVACAGLDLGWSESALLSCARCLRQHGVPKGCGDSKGHICSGATSQTEFMKPKLVCCPAAMMLANHFERRYQESKQVSGWSRACSLSHNSITPCRAISILICLSCKSLRPNHTPYPSPFPSLVCFPALSIPTSNRQH